MSDEGLPVPGRRIAVIGVTGSGKTTLADCLARSLDITHVELDALHWDRDWSFPSNEVFRERVASALQTPGWVTDGNYSEVRRVIWSQADTVIWLDYPFLTCLWRLMRRSFTRVASRQELWNGNRESLRSLFFSRDSLFLWLFKTYPRRRREYPRLFALPENSHLQIIRLGSPQKANSWLAAVRSFNSSS